VPLRIGSGSLSSQHGFGGPSVPDQRGDGMSHEVVLQQAPVDAGEDESRPELSVVIPCLN